MLETDPGRDHALTHHWRVPGRLHDLPGLSVLGKSDQRRARASVLACAVIAHGTEHPAVSYSRRQAWYVDRYEGVPLTYRTVTGAVDEAVAAGYLDGVRAMQGDHLRTQRQSIFWATPMLVDLMEGVRLEYERGSSIRLRDANGDPVAFRETERVARMRRDMTGIREALAQVEVGISPKAAAADWDIGQHRIRARRVKDGRETWATVTPTPGNDVYRVFGRGRFDKGGRLYGWWQSLPKDRRGELLINNEFTCEPDYAFLHPTLLYALSGAVLVGDPYETDYFPRAHGKLALNVSLNAMSLALAVNAIMFRNVVRPGSWPHTRLYTERLVEAVVARNKPIAACIGADRGIDCMAIDSSMAVKVLKTCARENIPCLPVHDSFRVRTRDEAKVTAIMGEVLEATRVAISPSRSMVSMVSFPHTNPDPVVAPLPEPVVAPSAEPVVSSPEPVVSPSGTGARFRPVLRPLPPRPGSPRPRVVAPPAVPVGLSPAPVEPPAALVVSPPSVPVPAFLLALRPPPEPVPAPSPELPPVLAAARPRPSLALLAPSLPPADMPSGPVPLRPAINPSGPARVFLAAACDGCPADASEVPYPPIERVGLLGRLAAQARAMRDPASSADADARMAELRALASRQNARRVAS
ncbi:hypothetical protein [Methylobacterium brachiatum]|uniref:hypothetical protein n=1 Tax=Methylobacterium brachiatum TaxID=269660 RepID=UPI00244A3E17|nr:hypothetical protein [Methylobacterium brachiatum]MDH2309171.1 hypothetical protein [Methylobacterium brachiatum]